MSAKNNINIFEKIDNEEKHIGQVSYMQMGM